jgi:hypothetical protein
MKKILFTLCLAAALTGARGQIYIDSYRFGQAVDDTSVVLLLNFNGANNDTVFTDASTNNFTITRFGTPVISTAQSKFGGASGFFNAQGNVITAPDDVDFDMAAGNFTIETWLYTTVTNQRQYFMYRGNNAGQSDSSSFGFEITALNKLTFLFVENAGTAPGNLTIITSTGSISQNTWTHIAAVRNGDIITLYIDGTSNGTANVAGKTMRNISQAVKIADYTTVGDLEFRGYLDDLRITKGKAVYTANFTAPTSELTKVTN